jgi:hypothetical protein
MKPEAALCGYVPTGVCYYALHIYDLEAEEVHLAMYITI